MATAEVTFAQEVAPVPDGNGASAATDNTPLPFDLASVPADYWQRAANPNRMRDMKINGSRDVMPIPPSVIKVDPNYNPRDYRLKENRDHLDELKASIREEGVRMPLICRWDFFAPGDPAKSIIVTDGECRLRACLELLAEGVQIASVPVMQDDSKNEADRLLTSMLANGAKPLSKWEDGGAFKRFIRLGWNVDLIAKKTGKTKGYISQAVELADAPDEVKQLLSSQAVTPSLALAELRANGSAAVQNLQAAAKAAKSTGKKGPAKRAKKSKLPPAKPRTENEPAPAPVENAPAPTGNGNGKGNGKHTDKDSDAYKVKQFTASLNDLLKDVEIADLTNPDVEWVSVAALKLLALSHLVNKATEVKTEDVKF
jgi:ParB/RepB/Spo0J family partition protein